MKQLNFVLAVVLLFAGSVSFAQMPKEDQTHWTYEVKKISAGEYQLIFHLVLNNGWFIWALQPGGDGTLVAPAFTFDKNNKVKLKGAITENGKRTVKNMNGINGTVAYYMGKADYVQNITATGKTKITGVHEYQVCNDRYAQPPKNKKFVFEIK